MKRMVSVLLVVVLMLTLSWNGCAASASAVESELPADQLVRIRCASESLKNHYLSVEYDAPGARLKQLPLNKKTKTRFFDCIIRLTG